LTHRPLNWNSIVLTPLHIRKPSFFWSCSKLPRLVSGYVPTTTDSLVISVFKVKVNVILYRTVSRPVCPGVRSQSRSETSFSFSLKFSLDGWGFIIIWSPLWRRDGSVI
jgi:hypothetical protein